jgi:hypothetical protein
MLLDEIPGGRCLGDILSGVGSFFDRFFRFRLGFRLGFRLVFRFRLGLFVRPCIPLLVINFQSGYDLTAS